MRSDSEIEDLEAGETMVWVHDLYVFSVVYDVPIAYLLAPPPGMEGEHLVGTNRPVIDLYAALLGRLSQLELLDERLRALDVGGDRAGEVLEMLFGGITGGARSWGEHYVVWRDHRFDQLQREDLDDLRRAASLLGSFVRRLQHLAPEAYLRAVGDPAAAEDDSTADDGTAKAAARAVQGPSVGP